MMKIKKRQAVIISAAVVAAAVSSFAVYSITSGPNPAKQSTEEITEYVSSEKFQNLERDERHDYFRTAMNSRTNAHAAAYAKLPVEEKPAYLDKVIDEMGTQRQQFSQLRRSRRDPNATARRREMGGDDEQRQQQRRQMRSPEGQRARMESVSPEVRDFRRAIRQRMRQRGIRRGRGRG